MVLTLGVALEIGTRSFIYQMSAGLSRLKGEWVAATQYRLPGSDRRVLLVGNSLLEEDIDLGEINRSLNNGWVVERFAISLTSYFDWYFGMRRILAGPSRPDVIIFCFEPRHIVETDIRGEIFAHYLMQKTDVWDVRRATNANLTGVTDLLLANMSAFYALRMEIRKNLLQKILPDLPALTGMIARSPHPLPDNETLDVTGRQRLAAAQNVATASGSRFMLILTPPVRPQHAHTLLEIGREIDVPVLSPLNDGVVATDYQPDEYHLNLEGRRKFTQALIPQLVEALNHLDASH
jgi:hypothetical protein